MQYSIGDVLALLDKTVLNPSLTIAIPFYLHYFTDNKLVIDRTESWLPYSLRSPLPPLMYRSIALVVIGLALRVNRFLSRKALNNGTTATFHWDREIVVVTGGSGGIGAQAARKLAARGSKVVVIDVIPLTFEAPKNLHYYKCDLTDFKALQGVSAAIEKDVGTPTCVVANAGICRGKPILEATERDIQLTFGVNNLGLLWTAKCFLPAMAKKDHGHFLIIASQTGHMATAGVVDYAATKSAALAIYEGLHTEMKHVYQAPSVRISCISPSAVRTKMFDGIKTEGNFFLPMLTPDYLGDLIAKTLWDGRAVNIMTPAAAYISTPSKLLPEWMKVGMQDAGADIMTALTPHRPLD